jgi:dihydrofolate reductase
VIVSLIAALEAGGGIGKDGSVPWHLSDDLKQFKRLTMGHHVLMGRKTYQSVAGKLPGRNLIVLSRDPKFGTTVSIDTVNSLEEGMQFARDADEQELFIIGGAEIFAQALPIADRFYLTRVHAEVECDTFFPPFDLDQWHVMGSQEFRDGGKNDYAFDILHLERPHSLQ